MKPKTILLSFVLLLFSAFLYTSCKKKKTNDKLYDESQSSGLAFYKGKDTIYSPKGGSPHGRFKLKFNAIASADLGSDGKLPSGGAFKEGAVIVKEVYNGSQLELYVVMRKDRKSKFAAYRWVWGEYKPNGDVVYDASKKGEACTNCHTVANNRDYTLSFDLH
ncbi:MAG: cytochrome P460 family protein [Sediminibacterium sp.]|nr:cytochrome P460 family protein [Sediminibacterium sp.]